MLYESKHPLKAIINYSDAFKSYFEEPSGFHKVSVSQGETLLTFEFFKHIEDKTPMYVFIVQEVSFISFSLENVIVKNS